MASSEGRMVTTDDGELAERLRLLRNHGQTSLYRHELLGYNWRMTEMQAAVGCVQLEKLDGIVERKRANARWMGAELASVPDVTPPAAPPDREHAYMLYTVKIARERDRVLRGLQDRSIQARISVS